MTPEAIATELAQHPHLLRLSSQQLSRDIRNKYPQTTRSQAQTAVRIARLRAERAAA